MQSAHIMVLLIVFFVIAWRIVDAYLKRPKGDSAATKSDEAEEMMARIEALEERIRVLEKIVTDPRENLSRQIDGLR